MQVVSVEELVTKKILPYNIFNEEGDKIFSAGEVLTPGKLLQLRYISVIYRDEAEEPIQKEEDDPEYDEYQLQNERKKPEYEDYKLQGVNNKEEKENETNRIPVASQKNIKKKFSHALEVIKEEEDPTKATPVYIQVRDTVVEEVLNIVDDITFKSELQVFGDYDNVHGVNVACLSTLLAHNLHLNEAKIRDVTLAALLHDVGETKIPAVIREKLAPNAKELKLIELHPQIGYKIIKKDMGLPDHIAKVALEHHERNDGSGYPYGVSGDLISQLSQIVIVADTYDTIMSGRSTVKVKNAKEAITMMLNMGSKIFAPEVLYTFAHLSNFNDLSPALMNISGLNQ